MTQYVPVTYRAPRADDVGFIYNSWLKSLSHSAWARSIPKQIFFANHKQVIAKILEGSHVVIASNPEDSEQILGYAVFQPSAARVAVVHYLYVKHPYRRLGIATGLLDTAKRVTDHDRELPVIFTHRTGVCDALSEKWNFIYNPYVMGADLHEGDFNSQAS